MSGLQSGGNLACDLDHGAGSHGAAVDGRLQRAAAEQLHDEERPPFVLGEVVDRADPAVVELREDAGLVAEPLQRPGLGAQRCGEHLDGDVPAEVLVLCSKDDAHPAGADLLDEPVAIRQLRIRRERVHRRRDLALGAPLHVAIVRA